MPQSLSQTHRISIHAPAKGATHHAFRDLKLKRISIHAPAKGATILRTKDPLCVEFQSTLPRRERHIIFVSCPSSLHFNSRSREGSDGIQQHVTLTRSIISIHAPAKGATRIFTTSWKRATFQFTLPRRERRVLCCQRRWESYFNSRSREGSDRFFLYSLLQLPRFQFTLPRRERPNDKI